MSTDILGQDKHNNFHLFLKGSFWFFLVLYLVLFYLLVLQFLSQRQKSENLSRVLGGLCSSRLLLKSLPSPRLALEMRVLACPAGVAGAGSLDMPELEGTVFI